jgi:hypothetical protein
MSINNDDVDDDGVMGNDNDNDRDGAMDDTTKLTMMMLAA